MTKAIVYIVLGALLGGFTGKFIIEQIYEKHHHARSVMKLLYFHEERLDAAAKASHCADFDAEQARLVALQPEIATAFPKAYGEDAVFKKKADALATVLQSGEAADAGPGTCPAAAKRSKQVSDTCDDCHKVYDPE